MHSPSETARPRPVILCVLDGWGLRPAADGPAQDDAIAKARTPTFDRLFETVPWARLQTSGLAVGLPDGQMGNSEVGHMNLGAGRVVMQDLPRIDAAVESGALAERPALVALIEALTRAGGRCHLAGLASPGGVHAHQAHLVALTRLLTTAGIEVLIHLILDGRDTPPQSATGFVTQIETALGDVTGWRFATVAGRYYAMDRDKNWDRIEKAYDALVTAKGHTAANALGAIEAAYGRGEIDEFVVPTVLADYDGARDGDGLLFFNFRADRARQILTALLDPAFDGFARRRTVGWAGRAGMVSYSSALDPLLPALFPPEDLSHTLGEVVAEAGLSQLRIAETEKYAHVTFFFSGGREEEFPRETRILVPSPKVATYDLKPEMSAPEVTDKLVGAIEDGLYDVIIVNYANPDMVGHTGVLPAAIEAIEAVDRCIGRLEAAVTAAGGVMLITADHGNAEMMRDPDTGAPHTAHTRFDVPLLLAGTTAPGVALADGRLCDVAPTLLRLLGLAHPVEMTGHSLIVASKEAPERRENVVEA